MTTATVTETRAKAGKYLTFALGKEEYGIEILKVREIIGYMTITAVPQMPGYVKGIINLRGQVIPVVDLRSRFGMENKEITDQSCIIVVDIHQSDRSFFAGLVVDHVQEVLNIEEGNIDDAPQFGTDVNTDFLLGIGKSGSAIKLLLDIDRVLEGMGTLMSS
jgi:purine-binding chemotaxis protein CheW